MEEEDKKDWKKESKQCKPLRRTQTNSVEFSHERLYLQRGCQAYPAHHPLPLPLSRPLIFQIPSTPPLLHCNFPASKLDLQTSFCKQKSPRRTLPETKVGIFPALHDAEPVQKTTILLSGKERTDDNATSLNELQEFKKALQALMTCRRPDCYGTEGSPIFLLANHFLVKFDPMQKIFHYDVNISPRPSKDVARMIKRKLAMENSDILAGAQPAFDGRKNLYSSVEFQEDRIELFVKLPISTPQSLSNAKQSPKLFRVCIRLVSKLSGEDLSKFLKYEVEDGVPLPQDYLQALDVVLREGPMENFISVGRSLYSSSMGVVEDIGGGAVGLRGFFQSLRPTQQGLALNVDFSVTAFHESIGIIPYLQKCFEFLKDLSERKSRGLAAEEKKEVERALKNIRIFVSHRETDQRYCIFGLTNEVAKNLKFRDRDGRDLTLIGYFKEHYNHEIQFKNLPCLQISRSKPCYLPMELCMICEGQKYLGKLSDHQTARILKMGCRRPIDRRNIINQVMKGGGGPNSGCYADEFKLSVSREMTVLRGRVLQPPKPKLGNGGNVRDLIPTRHDRQWNLLNSHVAEGSQIKRWALISFGGSSELNSSIPSFISQLSHKCDQLGIILNKTTIINPLFEKMQLLSNVHALESKLRKIHEGSLGNLQLLMCVMEKKHKGYADLKRIAETSIGVVSQCCLYSNLSNLNPQFLTNLALKINAKLGGSNVALYNTLPCQIPRIFADDEPAIFIGADVTHPHPLDDFSPSVAAVVGSMNWPAANKYISRMRSQTHRQEIIEELEQMVIELLDEFLILVYKLPMAIILFRDGVSETQFSKVLKVELQAIKKACSKFPCYKPKITFAVVQKRHHTRLFMSEKNSSSAPFTDENIPPGTVVDTVISHPREFDFYLCSHWKMKGTSRPTHYHVLWDENRFKSDEIQKLIHNLCYTFVRCTKPVALVPPAYYAHLAAYRGRLYLERSDLRSVMQSKISRAHPPETAPLPKVRDSVKKLMFYC